MHHLKSADRARGRSRYFTSHADDGSIEPIVENGTVPLDTHDYEMRLKRIPLSR